MNIKNVLYAIGLTAMCGIFSTQAMEKEYENIEQLVARLGYLAVPKEVFTQNILPTVLCDLIASKHAIDCKQVSRFLHYIQSLQKSKIMFFNHGWSIIEKIMETDCLFSEADIQELLMQPLAPVMQWLSANTASQAEVIAEIGHDAESICTLLCKINAALNGQLFQIFNENLAQLRLLWPEIKKDITSKWLNPLLETCKQDIKMGKAHGLIESLLHGLLAQPNAATAKALNNDLFAVIDKIPLYYFFAEIMQEERARNGALYFGLSEDQSKQIDSIFESLRRQMRDLEAQVKKDKNILMKDLVPQCGQTLKSIQKKTSLLDTHVCSDIGDQCSIPSLFQNPTVQVLFLAGSNQVALLEWLMAYDRSCLNAQDPITNMCPRDVALKNGSKEILELMVNCGIDLGGTINDPVDFGMHTPLHNACSKGDVDFVTFLLKHGANPNVTNHRHETPLVMAVTANNDVKNVLAVVRVLVQNGANINRIYDYDETPLWHASGLDSLDLVKLLIAKGADVNARNDRAITCLHRACGFGRVDIAEELLRNYAKVDARTNSGAFPYSFVVGCYGKLGTCVFVDNHRMLQQFPSDYTDQKDQASKDRLVNLLKFYAKPKNGGCQVEQEPKQSCIIS